jgi:hypothetical protein
LTDAESVAVWQILANRRRSESDPDVRKAAYDDLCPSEEVAGDHGSLARYFACGFPREFLPGGAALSSVELSLRQEYHRGDVLNRGQR